MFERKSLSNALNQENNSFGLLRVFLAILVMVSHNLLGGFDRDFLFGFSGGRVSCGSVAVNCFFVISGFWVVRSYLKTKSFWQFLLHRALRIFPGYWICLLVTAFVFGPVVYYFQRGNFCYFTSSPNGPFTYIVSNFLLVINQRGIADLFASNPYPHDFNGSLWVLKYFFVSYLAGGFLGLLRLLDKNRPIMIGLFVVLWTGNVLEGALGSSGTWRTNFSWFRVPDFFLYFLIGSLLFLERNRISLSGGWFVISGLLTVTAWRYGLSDLVAPITVPYMLIWIGFMVRVKDVVGLGNYSYGIYIYSFPLQQMLYVFGINKYGSLVYFGLSVAIAGAFAALSWRLVEKPCLQLRNVSLLPNLGGGRLLKSVRD
jgi:peptidoglycan/LPS O-acetylase OafA/YrhL